MCAHETLTCLNFKTTFIGACVWSFLSLVFVCVFAAFAIPSYLSHSKMESTNMKIIFIRFVGLWCCGWLRFFFAHTVVADYNGLHSDTMNVDRGREKKRTHTPRDIERKILQMRERRSAIRSAHPNTMWTRRSKLRLLKSRKICKHLIK